MLKPVLFVLLAIGVGAGAVDLLVALRADLVPPTVDLSHGWSDLADVARRVVLGATIGVPDLRETPPYGETRLMVALIFGTILVSCAAAFVVGGIASLTPVAAASLFGGAGVAFSLYRFGVFGMSPEPDLRSALETLSLASFASAALGFLAAHAMRRLNP